MRWPRSKLLTMASIAFEGIGSSGICQYISASDFSLCVSTPEPPERASIVWETLLGRRRECVRGVGEESDVGEVSDVSEVGGVCQVREVSEMSEAGAVAEG
eukprot:GHVN01025262.1.p2 GENE.GHVN01025262.1~~GHVN01025262.1.p2  ORF type:complete len:101 (-),score=29.98 GHVN01025262.1:252-554(-)